MYLDDDDLDDIGLDLICENEATREEIKAGLYTHGTWRIHMVDSDGRYWFIRETPEPEVDASDIVTGDIIATRKTPDVHHFETPAEILADQARGNDDV